MREDKQFKKIVGKKLSPLRDDISKELEAEFPEIFENKAEKASRNQNRKNAAIGVFVAAAACLAVALPCAFLLPRGGDESGPYGPGFPSYPSAPGNDDEGFAGAPAPNSYFILDSDLTIKEYNRTYGADILYFDLYDSASTCVTKLYVDEYTEEVFCIEERITSELVGTVFIISEEKNERISIVSVYEDKCKQAEQLDFGELKYIIEDGNAYGAFEYGDRRYGIALEGETDERKLFELVQNLFENR